jgi:cobalt-zinc-cadmium resistance protein CzcA
MLSHLIDWSLDNKFIVIALIGLMAVGGIVCALNTPVDAVPDMTNVQVQVITEAGSLTPVQVEDYVTYPVEQAMAGLPNVEEVRSVSKFGISVVTIVFHEGTDIYRSRQLVSERLNEARGRIHGIEANPEIGALSTALGEVLQFEVKNKANAAHPRTPMQLREILDWQIAPQLREVAGVTDVNVHGGYYRTFEVQVDPERLASAGVTLNEVIQAVEGNNASVGGGYIVHHDEQRFVRGQALLKDASDIGNVVVRTRSDGTPLLIKDLGEVVIAPMTRQGAVTRDGRGEAVTGLVMMLLGQNSRTVVESAKARLQQIEETLPDGVEIEITYDRAFLINRTLDTVLHNLAEGGILVIVVLLLLLGNIRAGVVVALAIPLSMLFAANVMYFTGITASLMSLGAIDFGLIVDSSVIMIENCVRRLSMNHDGKPHQQVVRDAAIEVRKPTMFGELIIAVVYVPMLALQGTEGKLFRPMALTVLFALAGSLVLSLTLMPVLAAMVLPKKAEDKEPRLIRFVKWLYRPLVEHAISAPMAMVGLCIALVATSIFVASHLGAEFMPKLEEGDILIEMNRLPSASLEGAIDVSTKIEKLLKELPEVKTVFCKTGRPEIANDVMGVQQTDVWVLLKDEHEWPEHKSREQLVEEMDAILSEHVPGCIFGYSQPIEMRVDELVAGVKADVAVLIYGDDLQQLGELGKKIEETLKRIPGAADVKADYQANIPTLTIQPRHEQLARFGFTSNDVLTAVEACGGKQVGQVFEGRRRFPIVVRFPQYWRENVDLIKQTPVGMLGGKTIPLGELADVKLEETPPSVEHEAGRRRTFVSANVRGRDVAGFVADAQAAVKQHVQLPTGYVIRWGGDFENLQSASLRLSLITPVVMLVIWLLLYSTFKSIRLALLIFTAVPVAASGGILALAARDMPFSISAGVGFIALFGVAVLNGLVWVSGAENARAGGLEKWDAARMTALARIRPVLMTAMVASLGFLPMAMSTSAGAEIQRPLATVVIGGLVTSTLLTALVIPAIYPWFAPKECHGDPNAAH